MSVSRLSAKQQHAARLLAAGARQKRVAAELAVDPRTVRRWQRLQPFLDELERAPEQAAGARAPAGPQTTAEAPAREQPPAWLRLLGFASASQRYLSYQSRAHLSENDWLNWHDVRAGRLTGAEKRRLAAAGVE